MRLFYDYVLYAAIALTMHGVQQRYRADCFVFIWHTFELQSRQLSVSLRKSQAGMRRPRNGGGFAARTTTDVHRYI